MSGSSGDVKISMDFDAMEIDGSESRARHQVSSI